MARDPGSLWLPLPEAGAPDGYTKTQFIYHSTGDRGRARSVRDNWFARADVVVESTFIVGLGPDDPTLQIMDSTDNADANYTANQRAIAVEVVGTGDDPFNDWQIHECIRLGIWGAENHPIERRICPAHNASGFGWHVMFGAPGPWTPVVGKVCPGARRIEQLKTVVFPAIFAEDATEHEDKEWWEMPIPQEDIEKIAQRVRQVIADATLPYGLDNLRRRLESLQAKLLVADANDQPDSLATAIVDRLPAVSASGGGLSREDVKAAIREVLGSLDAA